MRYYSFYAEYESDGSISYTFTTRSGTDYRVYFYAAKDYSDYVGPYKFLFEHGFICGITKGHPNEFSIEQIDSSIKGTVKLIFIDFFREYGSDSILLYHFDAHDGKQTKRNKLFERWYLGAKDELDLYKEDIEIMQQDQTGNTISTNYIGFLIYNSNSYKKEIIDEFHRIKDDLLKEK